MLTRSKVRGKSNNLKKTVEANLFFKINLYILKKVYI